MSKASSVSVTIVALLAIGVAGYAYYSPPFAADCKSAYASGSAWAHKQAAAAEQAWKKTKLSESVDRELKRRAAGKQQKSAQLIDPKRKLDDARAAAQAKKPLSEAAARQLEQANRSVGEKIAHGKTFAKHKDEFGFKTEDQMASHIDRVISFASSSNTKQLQGGGTLYWDERTRSVVIIDPKMPDGGTTFKPERGHIYFKDRK